jgi:hypothetical protein
MLANYTNYFEPNSKILNFEPFFISLSHKKKPFNLKIL